MRQNVLLVVALAAVLAVAHANTLASLFTVPSNPEISEWTSLVLDYERKLSDSSTFINRSPDPCTHASFNTYSTLPKNLALLHGSLLLRDNVLQQFSQVGNLTTQLDAGVRRLSLDVHYVSQLSPSLRLCRTNLDYANLCSLIEVAYPDDPCNKTLGMNDYGIHTGCTAESTTWQAGLAEINAWLVANPTQFVVLEIRNFADDAPAGEVLGAVASAFGSRLLTEAKLASFRSTRTTTSWPTRFEAVDELKTNVVAFISNAHSLTGAADAVLNVTQSIIVNDARNFTSYMGTCPNNLGSFESYKEDATFFVFTMLGYNLVRDGRTDTGVLTETKAQQITDCAMSACFDLISDAKLRTVTWSWAENNYLYSCSVDHTCVYVTQDGWKNGLCENIVKACVNETNRVDWVAAGTCPDGYKNDHPRNALEAKAARFLVSQGGLSRMKLDIVAEYDPERAYCRDSSSARTVVSSVVAIAAVAIAAFFTA